MAWGLLAGSRRSPHAQKQLILHLPHEMGAGSRKRRGWWAHVIALHVNGNMGAYVVLYVIRWL